MGKSKGGIGAVVGTVAAGPIGGLIGGGLGMGLDGSAAAARAAQGAANAQMGEARYQRQQAMNMTEGATVAALASYDKALSTQEKNIARQEQLISQIDPTVIEASQQALKLLKGEDSSTLAPYQRQRDQQRQKLLNSLRQQLGPGAETSSAGIQALTKFDSESANLFAGAQQQALGNLGNIFGQFNSGRPDILREAQGFGALATNRQGLRLNQLAALNPSNQQVFGTAGGEFAGAAIKAQGQQAFGNQLLGLGTQLGSAALTMGMGGMGGGGTPKVGTQAGGSYLNTGNMS